MSIKSIFAAFTCAMALASCGGGGSDTQQTATLASGQSITLTAGESVKVPAGTTITASGSSITVSGDNNTIHTSAGAVVSVPSSASGTADNTITAS